eukprot:4876733-Pleurochrysis_carterae.AAC.2
MGNLRRGSRTSCPWRATNCCRRPSTARRKCSAPIISLPARRCTPLTCLRTLYPEAGLRAASCLRLGRMVASTSNKTLQSKRASQMTASGATGFSHHLATPKSSVRGTQYRRHAASSFLTVPGLSPRECSAARQPSSCSCMCAVASQTWSSAN